VASSKPHGAQCVLLFAPKPAGLNHAGLAALWRAHGAGTQMEALWKSHLSPSRTGVTVRSSLEGNPMMLYTGKQETLGKDEL